MGKVLTHMTMSLDGFIAGPNDEVDELFEWYGAGDIAMPSANADVAFNLDEAGADAWRSLTGRVGALVSGRRLFDLTDGWGDNHPAGAPVVVVTHHPPADAATRWPRTTFAENVETGVMKARELVGEDDVTIMSPNVIQQALDLGLVDEVCVSLVPVLFGEGIPYFGPLGHGHLLLEDPDVREGRRALQLRYPVRRS